MFLLDLQLFPPTVKTWLFSSVFAFGFLLVLACGMYAGRISRESLWAPLVSWLLHSSKIGAKQVKLTRIKMCHIYLHGPFVTLFCHGFISFSICLSLLLLSICQLPENRTRPLSLTSVDFSLAEKNWNTTAILSLVPCLRSSNLNLLHAVELLCFALSLKVYKQHVGQDSRRSMCHGAESCHGQPPVILFIPCEWKLLLLLTTPE